MKKLFINKNLSQKFYVKMFYSTEFDPTIDKDIDFNAFFQTEPIQEKPQASAPLTRTLIYFQKNRSYDAVADTIEIIKYYVNYITNLDQKHYKIVFKRIGGGTFGKPKRKEKCV